MSENQSGSNDPVKMRIENEDIVTEDLFQTLIENFPDIIQSVDESGRIIMANRKATSLLGYSRRELEGMNVRDIYSEDVLENLDKGFANLREVGDIAVESELVDSDGKRIPVEIRSFSIYDDNGKFMRTFSILRDIRQIKELQRSLIQAERLVAVGEMASGILHDINNPLTVIRGCTDLIGNTLESGGMTQPEAEEIRSYAHDINRATKAIEKLSYHLRQFARGLETEKEVFDLYTCISDAIFITGAKIRDHAIRLLADLEKNTFFTFGSKGKIEQIFVNLIGNACDAMTDMDVRNLDILLDEEKIDGETFCRVTVSDTGTGIPEEIHEEIYKSFYTTKDPTKGTGLGLAITRAVLSDHGGQIQLDSEMGRGTSFIVHLPRHSGEETEG